MWSEQRAKVPEPGLCVRPLDLRKAGECSCLRGGAFGIRLKVAGRMLESAIGCGLGLVG